jgi:hypothetical protein
MEQKKLSKEWDLKEGDLLNGKKIVEVKYFEDDYRKSTSKLFVLEDGSQYMLGDDGLSKVEHSETKKE